jgi:hypothetical protein
MGYAVLGVVTDRQVALGGWLLYLGAVVAVNDGLLLPGAIVVGHLLTRRLPDVVRGPVRAALFASTMVLLVAVPLVLGYGRPPDNPSALPRDYGAGLAVVLAAVWLAAAAVAALRRTRPGRFRTGRATGVRRPARAASPRRERWWSRPGAR